jgi:hypothetical protein
MLFALADIAISITWNVSIFTLKLIYNSLYYLYYGNQPSDEELSRKELEDRISMLEEKIKYMKND